MRPERLQLEGFGTYREATTVEFTGAELFALAGATGSGKSTVIDGICFALYGNVPRLDDKRLVEPAISQGRVEAKVMLDFSVGGVGYRAIRVVRRGPRGGASTKEARLERRSDGETLAGNADELTEAVTRLLGLTYRHFTTCVVLPQGEFARFLHAKPSDRQDLLVELLDLGLYGAMRDAAKMRHAVATGRREVIARELELNEFATEQNRAAVVERVERLTTLLALIDETQPQLDELLVVAGRLEAELQSTTGAIDRLDAVRPPDGVDELAREVALARSALDTSRRDDDHAAEALAAAEAVMAGLPAPAELEALERDHAEIEQLERRLADGGVKVAELAVVTVDAARRQTEADDSLAAVLCDLEAAQQANRADEFVSALAVGAPCPICHQTVQELPDHVAGDVAAAGKAVRKAEKVAGDAQRAADEARAAEAKATTLLSSLTEQRDRLVERLAGRPGPAAVTAILVEVEAAMARLAEARTRADQGRTARRAAEQQLERTERLHATARAELLATRDTVADLEPPPPTGDDLLVDWSALSEWAQATRGVLASRSAAACGELAALADEQQRLVATIVDACAAAGIEAGEKPGRMVSDALSSAKADLESIDAARERVVELQAEDAIQESTQQVAQALTDHLKANRFEKWVLDEALHRLVERATGILTELSNDTYSLTLDAKTSNFCVIDHANADAVRSARTLSGGETFLASLALALALADEVAHLASGGAARLESIFLDEGFGTLDADTLDTVAGALEELQARGRVVGVISHVPELAERMPVRFEVAKGPAGSSIIRVDT